jgi:predicted nucleotidyltransferase
MRLLISDVEMALYRATAAKRKLGEHEELRRRREFAWELAQRGALLLKEEFAATQVILFGSLLSPTLFHTASDIDLAAWGIDEHCYLRALSRLLSLHSEILFDLVRMEESPSHLVLHIEKNGVRL